MKVECPKCKKILSVPDTYKNKRIRCKFCEQILKAIPLTIKIVVPTNIMQKTEAPKKTSEYKPRPSRSNFLTKIWTKSPAPFRNAFLATLGVLSALFMVYYLYGINKWFQRPVDDIKNYESSLPVEPAKSLPTIDANAHNLAVLIRLFQYQNSLEAEHQFCSYGAKKVVDGSDGSHEEFRSNWSAFLILLSHLQNYLEELYTNVKKLEIPENRYFITAHEGLLEAINAEHSYIKSFRESTQNKKSISITDKGDDALDSTNRSALNIMNLCLKLDPKLFEALLRTYKDDN